MMTGPAEWEFSGTFDPASGDWSRDVEGGPTADKGAA